MRVQEITGKIVLADGSTSEFSISADYGWQQWGAGVERLGRSVDVMESMTRALAEDNLMATSDDSGNVLAEEGVDRCKCGCKYWENDCCISCGESVTKIK